MQHVEGIRHFWSLGALELRDVTTCPPTCVINTGQVGLNSPGGGVNFMGAKLGPAAQGDQLGSQSHTTG